MQRFPKPQGMVEGTAVYRFYQAPGVLLYVGISSVPDVRFRQHAATAEWWPLVDHLLTEVVWRAYRGLAEAEEICAIIVERPVYNIKDKPGRVYATPPSPPTELLGVRARPLTEIRVNLSEVVAGAAAGIPTVVLKHGEPRAAFVSYEQALEIVRILGKDESLLVAV